MSTRTASWLAWSLWGLSLTLTVLALLLLALNLAHPHTHTFDSWLDSTLNAVFFSTMGAIVASRRSENLVGWLLGLYGLAQSISHFSGQYAIYALLAQPDSLPAGEAMAWVSSWLVPIIIGFSVFFILLFPTGGLPSRRWRWVTWLTVAFVLVGVILGAFSSGPVEGLGPIRNPLGIEGFSNVYNSILFTMVPTFLLVAAASSVFMRLRRAKGVERQQIKWFAYAAAATVIGLFLAYVIPTMIDTPLWFERASYAVLIAVIPAIPISIGIAILRYRLYDIDIIINRTLVYGSLTVTLVALYFGGIVVLQRVFVVLTGQQSTLAVVASTLLIAALFTPLRRRIQSFIDRRFYRSKYDARKTLEAFSAGLREETDLDALSDDLVGVVRETMQPAQVSLWLRPEKALKGAQTD
jgi:MFS family permease